MNHGIYGLVVVTALALAACSQADAAPTVSKASSAYVFATPQQAAQGGLATITFEDHPIESSIVTGGRVTFDDLRVGHVFSPVNGRVTRIDAALGQRVKKGDALALIASPDLGQASSDLNKADAALIAAEHDFARKRALLADKACSAADYEASRDTYRQAKAEKARAEQKVALLGGAAGHGVTQSYALTAPVDGEILARTVNPGVEIQGQYSNGGNALELFTVGELDQVWVLADVYENDVPRIQQGAAVSVSALASPGKSFAGTVDWIAGSLDPATRTVRVRCTLKNPERLLKPDMYTTVRLATPARRTPSLPRAAIAHIGGVACVFVEAGTEQGKKRYERVPVSVDERIEGDFVPVSHGLDVGAKVVADATTISLP